MFEKSYKDSWKKKAEKCEFHIPSITFLRFVFEGGQVKTDPEKVRAVLDWPVPNSRKELQCFLGFGNRRIIRNFSINASLLTALTSTKKTFFWTPEANRAFTELKQVCQSSYSHSFRAGLPVCFGG